MLGDLRPADQRHAHDPGDRFPRDVVLGRAEPAAEDQGIAPGETMADRLDDPLKIVADFGLEVGVDPGQRQLLAHPGGVGVDDLAEQQLGADGDDLSAHAPSPIPCRRCAGRTASATYIVELGHARPASGCSPLS
jgi:hypothetical protein